MFRTIFSSKYTTAVITDSANKVYLVPIKYTIGNYFVTELNKTFHVFISSVFFILRIIITKRI